MKKQSIDADSSKLLRSIKEKLDGVSLGRPLLRVSVADEPVWERSKTGDFVCVRWMCWSIQDGDREVMEPVFEVLSDKVTREQLARELPDYFRSIEVVVDNDIDITP